MSKYNPQEIEPKWQEIWEKSKLNEAKDKDKREKYYCLDMFPYPSGSGLHVGHWRGYVLSDVAARVKKIEGFNVLHPMGWDAFGSPAENDAIKKGIHPKKSTDENIAKIRSQLKQIGACYDWDREINTADPDYYKWTQWTFLQMFKKGLAYKKEMPINWCPNCKTGISNEDVVAGECERCGTEVSKKNLNQWMLKITAYADRLLEDLNKLDWPERVKKMQEEWIGRSEGANIDFKLKNSNEILTTFTTRPDTIFGITYLVLAPEYPFVDKITTEKQKQKVAEYIEKTLKKSEIERTSLEKDKTGVFTGAYALHPITGEELPIWIADYVLVHYGTGAIFAVPAHDDRDFYFANQYNLTIKTVIEKPITALDYIFITLHDEDKTSIAENIRKIAEKSEAVAPTIRMYHISHKNIDIVIKLFKKENLGEESDFKSLKSGNSLVIKNEKEKTVLNFTEVYTGDGKHIDSDFLDGLNNKEAIKKSIEWLEKNKKGKKNVFYKIRDWVFSRQRYWGEPIPIVDCEKCGLVPLDEKDLPLLLPEVKKYEPTGTGQSPLAAIDSWVNVKCPKCGGKAKRETDTMPQWAGSCWYFLRYSDPKNQEQPANSQALKYWLPVDLYVGGIEHAVLHLLYSRFWIKFLYDIKFLSFDEPFTRLFNQGMVYKLGAKMSKSKGNTVSSDELTEKYGADALRGYELFMAPPDQDAEWNDSGVPGVFRFLNKVWNFGTEISERVENISPEKLLTQSIEIGETELEVQTHKTIKKFNEALEGFRYNTLVSTLMEFTNYLSTKKDILYTYPQPFLVLILLLSPIAPHISEELWEQFGFEKSVFSGDYFWPKHNPEKIKKDFVSIIVQENGKLRGNIEVPIDSIEEEILKICNDSSKFVNICNNPKKVVYVKNRLINFVK